MSSTELGRRIRSVLAEPSNAQSSLDSTLLYAESLVRGLDGGDTDVRLKALESDLQTIHSDIVARSNNPRHTEVFLSVLSRLAPVMSSSSIISEWFDVCLRPALRNPELSFAAVRHAKDLVIAALHNLADQYSKLVSDFRRRLLELYLRDVINEGSSEDILEWAEMDEKERNVKAKWKANLEEIILRDGSERPADLLDEVNDDYLRKPNHRLQLLSLLNVYTSRPSFSSEVALILASHPFLNTLLLSLQLDSSSTACTLGVTIFVKVLPMFAMHAGDLLKTMIPRLLAVLARVMCFRSGSLPPLLEGARGLESPQTEDMPLSEDVQGSDAPSLEPRADLNWRKLEQSFQTSTPPSPHKLFTLLYYLFPCNVIRFLRNSVHYLSMHGVACPYTVDWSDALDEAQIKSKSEPLIQGHIMHPSLIWADADQELVSEGRWTRYDMSRIIGECTMLDVRHASIAAQHRHDSGLDANSPLSLVEEVVTPRVQPVDLNGTKNKPTLSIKDLVSTSLLLRSASDVDVVGLSGDNRRSLSLPSQYERDIIGAHVESNTSRVVEVLAALQRDVILLRNELNLELWLNRENVKHIGRLYEEHVLSQNAEIERQALHNRLRQYKTTIATLQKNFASHEKSASNAQEKYLKWNQDLQIKLQAKREETRRFDSQTSSLRSENGDLKTKLEAQGKLLETATHQVFSLETQIKETAHKVDRLRDYERRIDQLTATQTLWDVDIQKLKDQEEEMAVLMSSFKGMQLRLQSYEHSQSLAVQEIRAAQERVRELEAAEPTRPSSWSKRGWDTAANLTIATAERKRLDGDNRALRERTADMQDEIDILRAELEQARALSLEVAQYMEE